MNPKPIRRIRFFTATLLASFLLSSCLFAQSFAGISADKSSCDGFGEQTFFDRFEYPSLTYQSAREVAEMIARGEPLLDGDFLVAMQLSELVREKLSQPSLDYFNIIIDRARQNGVAPAETGKRIEFLVRSGEEGSWESLNAEAQMVIDDLREKPVLPIIFWGLIICDLGINACINDAEQEWEDCASGAICNGENIPNQPCCNARYSDDLLNCAVSCGTNGPDSDYGLCCQSGPQAPPSGG